MEAILRVLDRLVNAERRDPRELFQRRFIAGGALLGLIVAIVNLVPELAAGNPALVIAVFAVYLAGVVIGGRLDLEIQVLVWASLLGLTAFLFLQSIVTPELQPQQLAWLVLIPQVSLVLVGPRAGRDAVASRAPVAISTGLAFVVGIAVVLAHRYHLTLGTTPTASSDLSAVLDFASLLASVTGLLWLYDLMRRAAERELQALRRLLAMCAWCKKIHDHDEGWVTVERYMVRHEADGLTHGICPSCLATHFDEPPPG